MRHHHLAFFCIILGLGLFGNGCKSYERMPMPEYGLREPSIPSPVQQVVLDSTWQITPTTSGLIPGGEVLANANRTLYQAVSAGGEDTLFISNRKVELDGVLNTRDLGGIRTADGGQLKWGLLYRSGHLHDISRKGQKKLAALGMKTVIDLRTDGEVEHKPDRIPEDSDINHIHIPISGITDEDLKRTEKEIRKLSPEEFDGDGKMSQVMDSFAIKGSVEFAQIFEILLEEDSYPVVFHCTAGKDRTGLLSALILSALEVPQEVIFDEYLLSNYFRYDKIERNAKLGAWILGIDPVASRAIMDVRDEYLTSSFAAIEREYGSLDAYFQQALNLSPDDRAKLKELLLY